MEGILLVDKPKTWTSFDVVNYVRKIVANFEGKKPKNCKVGHTGTLDPLATGLLVVLVGKNYTRRAGEFSKADKIYEVVMRLGQTSTTGDEEGKKTVISNQEPGTGEVEAALQKFIGEIMQTPPAFSAMKINGKRAYQLAREGKEVKLEPRKTTVHSMQLTDYSYPDVKFTAKVSSGTYVRSLVEDIGNELGVGAYMADLRRTKAGKYDVAEAVSVAELSSEVIIHKLIDIA